VSNWLFDFSDTYGTIRLWVIAILGPALIISELVQGRLALGVGLGFTCVMVWITVAKRLGAIGSGWDRVANVSLAIGLVLLGWHYARWWWEYLR
jgi:hypothetical protein